MTIKSLFFFFFKKNRFWLFFFLITIENSNQFLDWNKLDLLNELFHMSQARWKEGTSLSCSYRPSPAISPLMPAKLLPSHETGSVVGRFCEGNVEVRVSAQKAKELYSFFSSQVNSAKTTTTKQWKLILAVTIKTARKNFWTLQSVLVVLNFHKIGIRRKNVWKSKIKSMTIMLDYTVIICSNLLSCRVK